ncbi:MAG TPA: ACP S-malonyltransferase [Candidatus Omnitrophota bacterium]|nr:ACP S-malonyltransferase [Candidatus Omnitrophota bacterium]
MSKTAFIFPGQGAQYVGMGKDLYETFETAKQIIDQADHILGNGLKGVMFEGPEEKLTQTSYCQPAILSVSYAAMTVYLQKYPQSAPSFVAGLSLGEYSALAASGALEFSDTIRLVERRGAFMNEAAQLKKGAMAAVIGMEPQAIKTVCDGCGAEVANFNAPDQTVITGEAEKVAAASAKLTEAGAKRVIPLSVSGAFHSSLMQPAADRFQSVLAETHFKTAKVPLVSNVDASPCTDPQQMRIKLEKQIVSSVQWIKTIEFMAGQGVTKFIEIGPGKVLKGLIRKINKDLEVINIEKAEDLLK